MKDIITKLGKHLSMLSIIIAVILVLLKIQSDLSFYNSLIEVFPDGQGDLSPSLVVIGMEYLFIFLLPILVSLTLAIIGMKRKNKHRKLALLINILTIVYLIIPVGVILAVIRSTH